MSASPRSWHDAGRTESVTRRETSSRREGESWRLERTGPQKALSSRRDPSPFAARSGDRMDRSLDGESGFEIDGQRRAARDAVQEFMGFDDLEVVEAHLMARRNDEPLIGRMRRTHQDLPEPLSFCGPFRDVDADLVETLLVEEDGAPGPKRLQ